MYRFKTRQSTILLFLVGMYCIVTSTVLCNQNYPSLVIQPDIDDYEKIIEQTITEPFLLHKSSYTSDVVFDKKEFDYLVSLKPQAYITAQDLKKSVGYLIKKNKFQKIVVHFTTTDAGIVLTFHLTGFWTFERATFRGVMIGKDKFRQYYDIQPGARFDEDKHRRSVIEIKEAFANDGYFEASVTDSLIRNEKTKSVIAKIILAKGSRFIIEQIDVDYIKVPHVSVYDSESLCLKVKKFLLKRLKGMPFSKKHIADEIRALKRYLSQKGFMYVSIDVFHTIDQERKTAVVQCKLELQHKREFIFLGNHYFSVQQLLESIFVFGRSAWLLPSTILSEELIKVYHQKGFWHVVIDSREENERYFFIIKEGVRSTIDEVVLENVSHFDGQKIVKDCFRELLKMSYYDEHVLKRAYEKITQWYAQRGFWQTVILKEEYKKREADNSYALHVMIDEGDKSTLIGVTIPAFPHLESEAPFKSINKKETTTVLEPRIITQQRQWLSDYFHKQGYLHVDIKHDLKRDDSAVTLVWHINPGQQVCFGKTILLDASGFPFEYIMNELAYKEGELWNREKLKQSLLNLKELEIFDAVHLYPSDIARQEPDKAIVLRLQKDDPFEIRTRVGFGVQQVDRHLSTAGLTYKFGVTFIVRNPFNLADQLKVETDFSRSRRSAMIGYRLPRLGPIPVRTIFKGYSSKYLYPGCIGTSKNLYQIKQEGFLVGMRAVRGIFDWGFNIGVEVMRTALSDQRKETKTMADRVARAIHFDPALLDKYIPYVVCEPILLINALDNPLNPTRGTFTLCALKSMMPFGAHKEGAFFVRFNFEQSFFVPLKPLVLVLHVRMGHIFLQNFQHIMPNERFYLGGANSIRSYVTDRCPPLGIVVDECGKQHAVPQGGKSIFSLNVEIRFPLLKGVGAALFQDIGFLSDTRFSAVPREHMLTGTGFGLYYVTPVGPLRFDFAFKWRDDVPTSRPYAWYLTFGQPF